VPAATTVNVAVCPTGTTWLDGCALMEGAEGLEFWFPFFEVKPAHPARQTTSPSKIIARVCLASQGFNWCFPKSHSRGLLRGVSVLLRKVP
jgi:hypothetical protein